MTVEPNLPAAEDRSHIAGPPAAGSQPLPQDDVVPPGDDALQPQMVLRSMSATATSGIKLDAARWSGADRVAGVATLVLFISLFLPWFTSGGYSVNGLWHGFEYLTLILALAVIVYLVARAVVSPLQLAWPVRHDLLVLTCTGINLLLVLIGFLSRPTGSAFFFTVTADWDFGAFFSLTAAVVAVAAAVSPLVAERTRQ
jgi:hypothetical protein